jgi:hypothetical protein
VVREQRRPPNWAKALPQLTVHDAAINKPLMPIKTDLFMKTAN